MDCDKYTELNNMIAFVVRHHIILIINIISRIYKRPNAALTCQTVVTKTSVVKEAIADRIVLGHVRRKTIQSQRLVRVAVKKW